MSAEQDGTTMDHAHESWHGRNTLSENLFIWNFFLSGNEIPGWQAHRIQKIPSPRTGSPYLNRSIWKQSNEETEKLLSVDTVECQSRADAHEQLFRMLAEFQGPVELKEPPAAGDVTFTGVGENMVLFARANLIIVVRNAGRDLVSLTSIAGQLDEVLTRKETAGVQKIDLNTQGYDLGRRIPLGIKPEQLQPSQWYKFFSRPGEVFLDDGTLVYDYSSEETPEITVLVISPYQQVANKNSLFGDLT